VFDGATLTHLRTLRLPDDADNIRCDAAARRVYVGCGEGALYVLDAATGDSLGLIPLPGHPESFQFETAGPRVFVNVPDASEVVIIDRAKGRVIRRIPIPGFSANFPMALDEDGWRLFVGCRRPTAVVVFDERSGRRLSTVPIDGDTDDLCYDGAARRLFASCGAGFIDVLDMARDGRFSMTAKIATAPGARTALYVPALRRLYVAVPHRGVQRPEIRVFDVAP
jgi:sugar lactone lactonase YvrE